MPRLALKALTPITSRNINTSIIGSIKAFSTQNAAVTEMETSFSSIDSHIGQGTVAQAYAKFEGSDLSMKSICEIMRLLSQKDISYEEYEHYFPMADELAHHWED
jgi:hypothetical protein